jgi:hypothetical protein
VHVDVEREAGPGLARVGERQQLTHVGGAAETRQARLVLERRRHLGLAHRAALQQPQEKPRIDRSGARGHHQPLEWGEPHRGVDRAPVPDGGERCPGAEVTGDHADVRPIEHLAYAAGSVCVRQAVEAEAP